ncbi:hypothetical protein [Klebsiella pneumoniae]|uniref:hypothetical protein n=1 Tax=Klebsiella pneumoniae TaxID=573 RepID=UPI00388FC43D
MSEVKVNGSACCDRSGRAKATVPAKDFAGTLRGNAARARAQMLRRVPAPFPGTVSIRLSIQWG